MSPHAAKARGIYDRAAVAPIGGHEGMPEDQDLMGNAQPDDEDNDALISELSLFDAGAGEEDGGAAPGTEDLAMAWPDSRLVRSASMSSIGSGDAEDSEVRRNHIHREKIFFVQKSVVVVDELDTYIHRYVQMLQILEITYILHTST